MSNYPRKVRPHATPKPPKQEPPPSKVDYYLAQKAKALSYNYAEIPEEHRELVQRAALDIRSRLKRTVEDMIEIGKHLTAIKGLLPHGQFTEWVEVEFDMNQRIARRMMDVARVFGDDSKRTNLSVLSADAIYLLAAPSTPDTVRWEVFEHIEMLDFKPTRAKVKEIIDAHKPPKPKQLPPPPEPEPDDAIDAEYTIMPKHEFIFPGQPLTPDRIAPVIHRSLAKKLQDALLHRIFKSVLTPDEQDELLVALTRALEE